jgi:nitrate/TMAO reductase-like tetraheme cytochrome c subunit
MIRRKRISCMKEKTICLRPAVWLLLVCCVLFIFLASPVVVLAQDSLDSDPSNQPQSAEECLACHSQAGQTLTLPSGEVVSTTITLEEYRLSIHGSQGFACNTCHIGYTGYPHDELEVETAREYTIMKSQVCRDCHQGQFEQVKDSVHFEMLQEGNLNAPVCSDCHYPHAKSEFGQSPLQLELALTSQVCAQCHNTIYIQYAQSVHGVGLFQQNSTDVPTCEDCHGIHSIEDPTTAAARLASPQLCAECHTNPAIMDKYGLSTDVLDTYVDDFHGTTVTIFEKTHPDQATNAPVCYDCHGVHDIRAVNDPMKGIQVKENLLVTCQRCHPDANIRFPDSWLGHYIPSPDRAALVYYVEQFYNVFIPLVLGGMALFVASDIGRRVWGRYRRNSQQPPSGHNGTEEG